MHIGVVKMDDLIPVDENGNPIGEAHPKAKLSNAEVEWIRTLYLDEGFVSYATLARAFNVPKSTIQDICTFRRRNSTPVGYRKRPKPRD